MDPWSFCEVRICPFASRLSRKKTQFFWTFFGCRHFFRVGNGNWRSRHSFRWKKKPNCWMKHKKRVETSIVVRKSLLVVVMLSYLFALHWIHVIHTALIMIYSLSKPALRRSFPPVWQVDSAGRGSSFCEKFQRSGLLSFEHLGLWFWLSSLVFIHVSWCGIVLNVCRK